MTSIAESEPRSESNNLPPSCFARYVLRMRFESDDVPPGWRAICRQLSSRLQAINCEARADLAIHGPIYEAGHLIFMLSRKDRVVDGILRKADLQTQATCEVCGRVAKSRRLGFTLKALCARCFGPRKLQRELDAFNEKLRHGGWGDRKVWGANDLQPRLRAIIPENRWQKISVASDGDEEVCVTIDDIRAMAPLFVAVKRRLDEIIGES